MVVGIAGVGGIGSNIAAILIRSGVRRLVIADYDRVEPSNLNRQFYFAEQTGWPKVAALKENLLRINGTASLDVFHGRLVPGNLRRVFEAAHIIVEGVDVPETKKWIVETFADCGKPVVSASGIAGARTGRIRVRRIGNCRVVGDMVTAAGPENLFAHKVIMVAAEMSRIVLELMNTERK